jgi:outer membrane protein assembly factor BamA/autotransporter translocation and assembly factor TamB
VAIAGLSVVGLLLLGALVVHTPPFRALVLRYVSDTAADAGVRIEAERLDYNLFTRRAGFGGLRVSAVNDATPFFEAERIDISLPWRVLKGELAIDEIRIGRGTVAVLSRADGTTNLPASSDEAMGERDALQLGRVLAPDLAFEYRNEAQALVVSAPAIAVEVSRQGRVSLDAPMEITRGDVRTAVDELEGGLAFDGRDVRLSGLRIRAPGVRLGLDGTLALVHQEPSLDLSGSGVLDAQRLEAWGFGADAALQGSVAVDLAARGPLASPVVDLRLTSDRLAWGEIVAGSIEAELRADADAVDLRRLRADVAGGAVEASGGLTLEDEGAQIRASWRNVLVASLVDALGSLPVAPAGRSDGELTVIGPLASLGEWTVDARFSLSPAANTPRRVAAPGETRVRFGNGEWRLDGRHVVAGVASLEAVLTGRLQPDDLGASTIQGAIHLADTDLPRLVGAVTTMGLADVSAVTAEGAVAVDIEVGGSFARPSAAIDLRSDALAMAGHRAVDVRARATASPSRVVLERLTAEQSAPDSGLRTPGSSLRFPDASLRSSGSSLQAQGRGRIAASGDYTVETGAYSAMFNVDDWRLDPTEDLPTAGVIDVAFAGEGRGRDVNGSGQVTITQAAWRRIGLGDLTASVSLAGNRATIATRLAEFGATSEAEVGLAAPYPVSAAVTAPSLDLARVLRDVRLPTPVTGTAGIELQAKGDIEGWRDGAASLEVQTLEARAGELRVRLREPARARYEAGRLMVDRLEAAAGTAAVSASGTLPVWEDVEARHGDAILATLIGDLDGVVEMAAAAGAIETLPVEGGSGPLALLTRVTGSLVAPVIAADLELGPGELVVRSDLPAIEDIHLWAHMENDTLELRELGAHFAGARLAATGQAPLSLLSGSGRPNPQDRAVLQARVFDIGSSVAAPLVAEDLVEQVEGSFDVTLNLTAPALNLDEVQAEVVVERLDVSVANLPVRQRVPTRIVVEGGFARIQAWDWEGEGASLDVIGQVRLRDRAAGIVANGSLDLRLLTPLVREAGMSLTGRLEPRLSLTGPIDAPTISGDARLSVGEIRLADPRVAISDLSGAMLLSRDRAHVTSLSGTINGGTLMASGQLQYAPGLVGRLATSVSGMALDFPEGLRTELDAELQIDLTTRGRQPAEGRVSGLVTVNRGGYRQPLAIVRGLLDNLRQATATTTAGEEPSLLDRLALDVRLVTDEDLVIQNNVARAEIDADLRVIGTAAAPALSGRAELREGGQLFLGRNVYTVQSGTIDFANPVVIEPTLGIVATTRVGGEDIEIRISGTPETMKTDVSVPSNPDIGQADATSLLLTGRQLDKLTEAEASVIGAEVLGNLSGDVLGLAGRAVGLDTLRIGGLEAAERRERIEATAGSDADAAGAVDPTSRLTFGRAIGSKLDVIMSQNIRNGDQTWIIDYSPVRQLALRLVSDDENLRSYAFRHDMVFGVSPTTVRSGDVSRRPEVRVAAVRFEGEIGFPEGDLRRQLRLEAGDRFDFITWQADRDRLERFYRQQRRFAARVGVDRIEEGDGVSLIYSIDAGPMATVRVDGAELSSRVVSEIETAWAEAAFEAFLVEEVQDIIGRDLASRHYFQGSVKAELVDAEGQRTLDITVDQGPHSDRVEVRVDDVEDSLRAELGEVAELQLRETDAILDRPALRDRLLGHLNGIGYLQAEVEARAPEFDGPLVTIPVSVEPGSRFTVGAVVLEGAQALAAETEIALESGAVYRPADVEFARNSLQTDYRREGFAAAAVTARTTLRGDAAIADVTFVVQEGPRQVVAEIDIVGRRTVSEEVITRALGLTVGDGLRPSDWMAARRRLVDTGLFRRVDVTLEGIGEPGTEAPVRLRVLLEEWPALRVRYGFEVAEERPEEDPNGRDLTPGFTVDMTRRTLFGREVTIGTAGRYRAHERGGRVFLTAPTLFSLSVQSSLVVERSREEFEVVADTGRNEPLRRLFVTDETTTSWEQRARLGRLSLSYAYRYGRNTTFTKKPDVSIPTIDVSIDIARLTGSGIWDSRDDPADSTSGTFVSSTIEYAADALGSDFFFVRSLSQAYRFRSWRGVVFASAARLGVARPLGGQDLILSERFYAGGGRTVRSVSEDALGPVDFFGPTGGGAMLVLNQEVRFPIYRWIRGVAFVDAGNVFARPRDISLRQLVGAGGLGLRVTTPFTVLRADYAKGLWNTPAGQDGRWIFGIGHTF